MTTFYLIRHAQHELAGKGLAGRMSGLGINAEGVKQAEQLVARLAGCAIDVIYTSPRERAQETAAPLARALGQTARISEGLDDVDFGAWTGRLFTDLQRDPQWSVWINTRTAAQPPGGELIAQVQRRMINELIALSAAHTGQTVALISHCDVIKCAIAHYLAIGLNDLERFAIEPASISVVKLRGSWAQVERFNDTGPLGSV